ncbi:DNA replication factor Cdt1 isoform X2 [Toxorhynchites rutilus septentrionalis]|uniref:DNA replication factor Cdt1 isoform X2 n=1 Tax=Toxorhynchites rutilus septentrionalis TaxID=329112 RepID=UPI00247B246F|nr:DNA replication factor Cdt1 isoform X2 [Toxorhynchites rutilus septentrionalis]
MSQPTVAAYFNTRKRVAAEELSGTIRNKNFLSKNAAIEGSIMGAASLTPETKRITRSTRSIKRIGAVTVDEKTKQMLDQPKLVKFLKMGALSPKKKMSQQLASPVKASQPATVPSAEFSVKNNASNVERGMRTPTKQTPQAPVRPAAPNVANMPLNEIKSKLSRSARLAELKTSLNKLQNGFDRLDRMEKVRLENSKIAPVPPSPTTAARNLKEFQTLEVEVPVSPLKAAFISPTKMFHRTPTKANHSSLMSPQKTITPKKLSLLMSPIKEPSATPVTASPTKVPAYQRFQNLAEAGRPALQLPYKYRSLAELFKCIDTVCSMFHNRKEQITFKKLKPAVQRMARKNLFESHLAQIKTLFPDAFVLSQELTKNYGSATKHDTYQLVIKPNVEEKVPKHTGDDANIVRSAQDHAMNPQVIVERGQKFHRLLLEKAKEAHVKFLRGLDPPVILTKEKITRWHPEFDLESCPDIEKAELPQPPNVERFSSAKDVLSTARNLFNCGTAMERAFQRLEEKKRQAVVTTTTETTAAPVAACGQEDTKEIKPSQPTETKTEDPRQAAFKNIPKALLEKIRAKQAAKALDQMTRPPSQDREAIKYSRLPEIARHLRNVFITEKKGVLPLEMTLVRIENSYRSKLSVKELEEHLKMIAKITPFWLTMTEVRKTMYAKIVKDYDLAKVIKLLEKKANEVLES